MMSTGYWDFLAAKPNTLQSIVLEEATIHPSDALMTLASAQLEPCSHCISYRGSVGPCVSSPTMGSDDGVMACCSTARKDHLQLLKEAMIRHAQCSLSLTESGEIPSAHPSLVS